MFRVNEDDPEAEIEADEHDAGTATKYQAFALPSEQHVRRLSTDQEFESEPDKPPSDDERFDPSNLALEDGEEAKEEGESSDDEPEKQQKSSIKH